MPVLFFCGFEGSKKLQTLFSLILSDITVNYLSPTCVIVCNGVFSIICRRTEAFFSSMLKHGHNKNQKPFLISSLNFLSPAFF